MRTHPSDALFVGTSELAALMRRVDWGSTPIGPSDSWPQSVRAIVRMMLTSRYAMWMGWGPDLRFFYNDAYGKMTLGAKHPWALGRPASEVWAEIWPDIGPRIDHVLDTGEATWDEGLLLFLERSGFPEETYHTFSYSPLHDDDGRIAGMFCVVTEETTRVIGERRLTMLRELASQLSLSPSTGDVWMAMRRSLAADARDLPFTLTYLADDGAEGARLAATTGLPIARAFAPDTLPLDDTLWPLQSIMDATAPAPTVVDLPSGVEWPRGPWQKRPTRAIALPIPQQAHVRPAGVFIAGLNPYRPLDREYEGFLNLYVGQLAAGLANAQAYAAERRRAEALAQIDRAKTTFFSNVSHELRTPLTLMLGPVADALTSGARTLNGDALELVHRSGLRLQRLVNTLLDFSRIEAGRTDASYEAVDLAALTAELTSAFESVIRRAGLTLIVDCAPGGEPTYVDRDMWEKIVFNLISNAYKFTFDGDISVSVTQADRRAVLQVRDTGTGIPAEELPRIFDRFHRVEGARGRTHEGTGIGLALVCELVKLHAGSIDVQSEVGRGTAFTVTVPLGTSHLPADRIASKRTLSATTLRADAFVAEAERWTRGGSAADAAPEPELGEVVAPAGSLEDARIVVADDNADMRAYLRQLLGARWRVHLAADGREALALARTLRPDLVITDVMMPLLDGIGLLRELRAHADTQDIPVMMLSARAGEEARAEGYQAGADDYVVKPFTARELVARVQAQLLRARIRAVEDEQRRRLAEVFMHAPVAVAILRGPTHVFEFANPRCLELVNRRALVGQPIREALPELQGQPLLDRLDEVFETGREYVGRSQRLSVADSPPADRRYFDFVFQPIFDQSTRVVGIAAAGFEVTELARARQAAEDANRAKDEFLAMLGHELRNPLAPILTALQLLRLRGVAGGERERAIIERQVGHLVGLVDDLLDVSRITRGKIRLKTEAVELTEIVAKGIELASPLLEQHQHDLVVSVPRRGLGIMADPARLAQVVSNLLTNAAKYTPPGGRIRVEANTDGGDVVLRVSDTGIGIDPQMLPKVFELFTQDRQALDRAQGGLGLGLAIVRSLVSLHGGTASAHSDGRNRGSEFVIRLPRVEMPETRAGIERESASTHGPSGLRVLVVDDNEDAAAMLADVLTEEGHVIATAHDGPTALDVARRFHPHVALLDIGLPVMDGFDLAVQFRSTPSLQNVRLVAVTGYGQEHDRRRSAAAGFDAHLVKPVDLDQLARMIHTLGADPPGRSDSAQT
jgi:signal transduction histidine kinase